MNYMNNNESKKIQQKEMWAQMVSYNYYCLFLVNAHKNLRKKFLIFPKNLLAWIVALHLMEKILDMPSS